MLNLLNKKKTMALLMGLAVGMTSTAFAAENQTVQANEQVKEVSDTAASDGNEKTKDTADDKKDTSAVDSFSDVPQGHWAYEALDYLAKHNVIEGYKDGTFQGNRTMTRYEMASIVANAMKSDKGDIGDKAVLKQLEAEFHADIQNMQKQIDANKADIEKLKEEAERVKIYGFGRVSWDNDNIKGYSDQNDNNRFYLDLKGEFKVNDNWKFAFESETNQRYARYVTSNGDVRYHEGHDDSDGVIQRVWAEGNIGKLHVDVGRRWRGLGFQNVLLGNETDGVVLDYPLDNNGLKALAFYQKPTDAGYDFGMYGLGIQGPVSKNLQLNLAYAMLDIDKDESPGYDPYNGNVPLVNTFGSHGLVLSAMWNPLPNITLIGDYVRTNAAKERVDEWAPDGTEHIFDIDENESKSIRLNYRWTNLNDPGSFQLYTRWFDYGRHGNIMGDEEWGLLKPGSKGWVFGFKYVPAKNVEWETMYEIADMYDGTYGLKDTQYKRHFIRTQVDFHF